MISFIVSFILLVVGYFIYGKLVEKCFGVDEKRVTPAFTHQDGVDFMPMSTWRVFLIQFLNIAGTGPIFGAILGILYGPAAFLWIVLGCILGGAVHDYMTGMICIRKNGMSLPEFVGDEMGEGMRKFMLILSLVLLVLVGTVFVTTPAEILDSMFSDKDKYFFITIIFLYYILATLLPIDKLIGKIYPVFGVALLLMAFGLLHGIFFYDGFIPEVTDAFVNHNPSGNMPLFPGICITIACGAVSGFHATQSPLMARCTRNEKNGRIIFYGAMITEGLVALIWAAASIKFASMLDVPGDTPYEKLLSAMTNQATGSSNPSLLVHSICTSWMGTFGAILAILGVIAAPITSGDTAFRSARLIIADFFRMSQSKFFSRLLLCAPLFAISFVLLFLDFHVLWRYFAWTNQTLACFALWSITIWLFKNNQASGRNNQAYLVSLIPAVWMTLVCTSYIMIAPEGFSLDHTISYITSTVITLVSVLMFIVWTRKAKKQ